MITLTSADFDHHLENNNGYCRNCKTIIEDHPIEPDAEDYLCPDCTAPALMGMETARELGHLEIDDSTTGQEAKA